jgi:hypothetical protein
MDIPAAPAAPTAPVIAAGTRTEDDGVVRRLPTLQIPRPLLGAGSRNRREQYSAGRSTTAPPTDPPTHRSIAPRAQGRGPTGHQMRACRRAPRSASRGSGRRNTHLFVRVCGRVAFARHAPRRWFGFAPRRFFEHRMPAVRGLIQWTFLCKKKDDLRWIFNGATWRNGPDTVHVVPICSPRHMVPPLFFL